MSNNLLWERLYGLFDKPRDSDDFNVWINPEKVNVDGLDECLRKFVQNVLRHKLQGKAILIEMIPYSFLFVSFFYSIAERDQEAGYVCAITAAEYYKLIRNDSFLSMIKKLEHVHLSPKKRTVLWKRMVPERNSKTKV